MKAVGIIGYHHTGKTTACVALIRELKARGYSVCSIKDIHSEAYRADKEGSNTHKHSQAGSEPVYARGLEDSALIFPRSLALHEVLPFLKADFLVIEGMKDAPVPKIVCAKTTAELDELLDDTAIGISGLIASELDTYRELPVFCLEKNLKGFVDLVIEKSFAMLPASEPECCMQCGKTCYEMAADILQGRARREDCIQDGKQELILKVDSEEIAIVPFVQKLLKDSILSFVHNLKGVDKDARIEITIKP